MEKVGNKVRVVWFSRHSPSKNQERELREKLGRIKIIEFDKSIDEVQEVVDFCVKKQAKYVVPNLPFNLIAKLKKKCDKEGIIILRPKMVTIYRGTNKKEFDKVVRAEGGRENCIPLHGFDGRGSEKYSVLIHAHFVVVRKIFVEEETL